MLRLALPESFNVGGRHPPSRLAAAGHEEVWEMADFVQYGWPFPANDAHDGWAFPANYDPIENPGWPIGGGWNLIAIVFNCITFIMLVIGLSWPTELLVRKLRKATPDDE